MLSRFQVILSEERRNFEMSYKTVKKVRVKVPASTANLGPGFDSLGMALNLYAWIDMAISN